MRVFQAPQHLCPSETPAIFLAGSIELGFAVDWQQTVVEYFRELPVTLYNPRRRDWDSTWTLRADDPQFFEQVTWELEALRRSDLVIMNLLPGTLSPISLLELGLFASSGKLRVCCPEDFQRAGNVEIVCQQYGIPLYRTLLELLASLPF